MSGRIKTQFKMYISIKKKANYIYLFYIKGDKILYFL